MEIQKIKDKLSRKATGFLTGGFRPTNSMSESWVGRVYLYKENEDIPTDEKGNLMFPIFQLCLENLPFVPDILKNTKVMTVFVSTDLPMDLASNGENWLLREYKSDDDLVFKNLENSQSPFKSFPLKPVLIEKDFPVWDGFDIPKGIFDRILELEKDEVIADYHEEIAEFDENHYLHKIGGYPTFCQSGISFGEGFEFAFQISSDEKANINIVDAGNIYLAKNASTNEWKFYCDFY